MHRHRWWVIGLVLVSALLAAAAGRRAWQQPLGPRLAQPGQPVEATVSAVSAANETSLADGSSPVAVAVAHPAPAGIVSEPVVGAPELLRECGDPPTMDLLVIGSDTRGGDYVSGRADFIRAVRLDTTTGSVRLLAIPRDLYVPIPLDPSYSKLDRINTAYAYGNQHAGAGGGPSLLAQTLYANFGLTFDHYVVVNFEAFVAGVDAIEGVDLDLPHRVDGTFQGLRAFPAGPQHLDGPALLDYIRIRYIDSDVHRGQRQDQVIRAVRERVLRPGVIADVPALTMALSRLILTDLSVEQSVSLACAAQRLPPEAMSALRIGWNEVAAHTTETGAQVLLPRMDRIMPIVETFKSGVP